MSYPFTACLLLNLADKNLSTFNQDGTTPVCRAFEDIKLSISTQSISHFFLLSSPSISHQSRILRQPASRIYTPHHNDTTSMASVLLNNWASTPAQFLRTVHQTRPLTDKQKTVSASKWIFQHLNAVMVLVIYPRTATSCNPVMLPYVTKADTYIWNNLRLYSDVNVYRHSEQLCRPIHEFGPELVSGRFEAFYHALACVLAPPRHGISYHTSRS